mmetsp:Transcript_16381/g.50111  ORF Transcript_16381/g.50111 Transcript_16381/m.50111 type:complete len:1008 (-) Transcript_16381:147-3170(-)
MDPWAMTPAESAQYDGYFAKLDTVHSGFLSGGQAASLLSKSGLPKEVLSKIWGMSDMDKDGQLSLVEFRIAMHLAMRVARGTALPESLPPVLVPQSHPGSMAGGDSDGGRSARSSVANSGASGVGSVALSAAAFGGGGGTMSPGTAQNTPQAPTSVLQSGQVSQAASVGGASAASSETSATVTSTAAAQDPWAMTPAESAQYDGYFAKLDTVHSGFLSGGQAASLLSKSGLPKEVLSKIWGMSDMDKDGQLSLVEFRIAMHLVTRALKGHSLPDRLPPELSPQSLALVAQDGAAVTRELRAQLDGAQESLLHTRNELAAARTRGAHVEQEVMNVTYKLQQTRSELVAEEKELKRLLEAEASESSACGQAIEDLRQTSEKLIDVREHITRLRNAATARADMAHGPEDAQAAAQRAELVEAEAELAELMRQEAEAEGEVVSDPAETAEAVAARLESARAQVRELEALRSLREELRNLQGEVQAAREGLQVPAGQHVADALREGERNLAAQRDLLRRLEGELQQQTSRAERADGEALQVAAQAQALKELIAKKTAQAETSSARLAQLVAEKEGLAVQLADQDESSATAPPRPRSAPRDEEHSGDSDGSSAKGWQFVSQEGDASPTSAPGLAPPAAKGVDSPTPAMALAHERAPELPAAPSQSHTELDGGAPPVGREVSTGEDACSEVSMTSSALNKQAAMVFAADAFDAADEGAEPVDEGALQDAFAAGFDGGGAGFAGGVDDGVGDIVDDFDRGFDTSFADATFGDDAAASEEDFKQSFGGSTSGGFDGQGAVGFGAVDASFGAGFGENFGDGAFSGGGFGADDGGASAFAHTGATSSPGAGAVADSSFTRGEFGGQDTNTMGPQAAGGFTDGGGFGGGGFEASGFGDGGGGGFGDGDGGDAGGGFGAGFDIDTGGASEFGGGGFGSSFGDEQRQSTSTMATAEIPAHPGAQHSAAGGLSLSSPEVATKIAQVKAVAGDVDEQVIADALAKAGGVVETCINDMMDAGLM